MCIRDRCGAGAGRRTEPVGPPAPTSRRARPRCRRPFRRQARGRVRPLARRGGARGPRPRDLQLARASDGRNGRPPRPAGGRDDRPPRPPRRPRGPGVTRALSTILVVDDDPSIRRGLAAELAAAGYETLEAVDGEEGARLAAERLCLLYTSPS